MTTAPANLLAVRKLLQPHLGLTAVEMGIVGDAAHRGGYHQGRDRVGLDDYSVRQSPRDRAGLSEYASALDIGDFELSVKGKAHNLRSFSVWLVAQCKAGAADTRDIREVIYSPDGRTVRRWDRLGKSTTGDSSHRDHTHVSYFRDATKAGRDLTGPYRRYLTEIGLINPPKPQAKATPREDNDMLMLKLPKDATVWLSRDWGDGVQRVALVAEDEMPPNTPLITVASEARLTLLGGPERKTAG